MKNNKILFKRPSLKRDDFISVLDAMVDERIYPGILYDLFVDEIKGLTGLKNIILLPSKWVAIKLLFDYINDLYDLKNIVISNNSDPFYYDFFKNYKINFKPIDINLMSLLPDMESILNTVSSEKDLIFISYSAGVPVDFSKINSVDVLQVADLSGSFFTFFNNIHLGKGFDFTIFSLKDEDIITTGDGAILYIKDNKTFNAIEKKVSEYNLKLSDFNCALGLSQLKKINKIIGSRKRVIEYYLDKINSDIDIFYYREVKFDSLNKDRPNFNNFFIFLETNVNYIKELFESAKIEINPIIEKPISMFLKDTQVFKNTSTVVRSGISIPIYPTLNEDQLRLIVSILNKIYVK